MPYLVLGLLAVPVYVVGATLVVRSGIFDFSGDSPLSQGDSRAVWAFLGAATAAAVSATGLLLTRSHNLRTLALQRSVEDSRIMQQTETDQRLKLDTAVAGLRLISDAGSYAPAAQVAGALATLVQLGQPVIALRCLAAGWPHGEAIDLKTATWTIEAAFASGDASAQYEAVHLASEHVSVLVPSQADAPTWVPEFSSAEWSNLIEAETRAKIVLFYMSLPLQRTREEQWVLHAGGYLLENLFYVLKFDDEIMIRRPVAEAMFAVLEVLDPESQLTWVFKGQPVATSEMWDLISRERNQRSVGHSRLTVALENLLDWLAPDFPPAGANDPADT